MASLVQLGGGTPSSLIAALQHGASKKPAATSKKTGGTAAPERKSHGPATNAPNPGAGAATPYDSQIAAESTLRFSPETSALGEALADALSQRDSSIASARSAAQGAIQTSRQAAPGLKAITGDVLGQLDSLAASTPGAASDLARTRGRLAERLGLATADNAARATSAAAGYQGAVDQANGAAGAARSKIMARLQAMGQEQGAYAQGRASELARDDANRQADAQQAADQNTTTLLAAGVDPTTGEILPGGPKDPKANGDAAKQAEKDAKARAGERAKSLASPEAITAGAQEIQRAMAAAAKFKAAGLTRQESAQKLLDGVQASGGEPIYTSSTSKTGSVSQDRVLTDGTSGTQVTTPSSPGFDPVKSPLWASIALDMVWDGGVSRNNVKRLHNPKSRFSVAELNANGLNLVTQTQRSKRDREASQHASIVSMVQGIGSRTPNVTG
jgi:hypothetical protein